MIRINLACGLFTPVDLNYCIDNRDLAGEGFVVNPHVEIVNEVDIDKNDSDTILREIETGCGMYFDTLNSLMKSNKSHKLDGLVTLTSKDLDDNGIRYEAIILKMEKEHPITKLITRLENYFHTSLKSKRPETPYEPHVVIAYVKKGKSKDFIEKPSNRKIIQDSYITFEDINVMDAFDGTLKEITKYNTIDRYFREKRYADTLELTKPRSLFSGN